MTLQAFVENSWKSRGPVSLLLRPFSCLYRSGVWANDLAYRTGLKKTSSVSVPVICVGNLTVGGVGKTPLVHHLTRFLIDEGRRTAIVSRGYGRKEEARVVVVSEGNGPKVRVQDSGDEPWMLSRLVPEAIVVVGADRVQACRKAIDLGAQAIVLDDGFQHRRLHRDLNICVFDSCNPWGNGLLLPAGPLREPPDALKRADFIFLSRCKDVDPQTTLEGILRYSDEEIPYAAGDLRPVALNDLTRAWENVNLQAIEGKRLLAFSGIGSPSAFERTLNEIGGNVAESIAFPDHHRYSPSDLAKIETTALRMNAEMIVTTTKDAVRLSSWIESGELNTRIFALDVRMEVRLGEDSLHEALRKAL